MMRPGIQTIVPSFGFHNVFCKDKKNCIIQKIFFICVGTDPQNAISGPAALRLRQQLPGQKVPLVDGIFFHFVVHELGRDAQKARGHGDVTR